MLELIFVPGLKGNACLSVDKDVHIPSFDSEYEYEISVDEKGVFIAFSESVGLIHAFLSMLQLLSPYRRKTNDFIIPFVCIKDKPALSFRGMHLCLFHDTSLTHIKKMVALCAFLKCSHICIETWGSLKLEVFPEFGWPDAATAEDLKEIVYLGRAMGVEFIPFMNHIGHSSQSRLVSGKHVVLDQNPEYEGWFTQGGWTWDVDNPEVIELHKKIRAELCEIFGEGDYFHIGCDEFADLYSPWAEKDVSDTEGFVRFLNRTAESVKNDIHRKPIMWGEMFLDKKDFDYPFCCNTNDTFTFDMDGLTEDMYVVDWQYNIEEAQDESVQYFLKNIPASRLILAPWSDMSKIHGRVNLAKKHNMLGIIGTTWGNTETSCGDMVFTACDMWEQGAEPYKQEYSLNGYRRSMICRFMRGILPSDGIYKTAGFKESEF